MASTYPPTSAPLWPSPGATLSARRGMIMGPGRVAAHFPPIGRAGLAHTVRSGAPHVPGGVAPARAPSPCAGAEGWGIQSLPLVTCRIQPVIFMRAHIIHENCITYNIGQFFIHAIFMPLTCTFTVRTGGAKSNRYGPCPSSCGGGCA